MNYNFGVSFLTCLTVVVFFQNVLGANILYIAPVASPSHHIWNRALAFGLVEKGHNVTMLGHDAEKQPLPNNFTLILLEGLYQEDDAGLDLETLLSQTPLTSTIQMYDWALFCCQHDLNTQGLQLLLNYPFDFKFDLIIFDVSLGQCLYPLGERFGNPPIVAVTPFLLPPILSSSFGNHLYTSYMPFYNTDFTSKMSFRERVLNFIYVYFEQIYRNYVYLPKATTIAKQRFGENIRLLDQTERTMSLLLCNIDPVMDYPISLPPNIIPVGGLQIKESGRLPQDLQEMLDGAQHGAILFSLGTNLRSDQLSAGKIKSFVDAFAKIPQLVLWKFEMDHLDNLPNNVVLRKWLPQNDVLGHKNTKLFISHGGALSISEAIYHGVPVLGLPFFCDQRSNIAKLVDRKAGMALEVATLTSATLTTSLTKMLNNSTYLLKIKQLSKLYRDQAQTPLERGVFWIEYVLRHGRAEHLVLPARDMPVYQINNLDVLVVFVLGLVLIYALSLLVLTGCRFVLLMRHHRSKIKLSK